MMRKRSNSKKQDSSGEDYHISRMPHEKRYSWYTVAIQRFGAISALAQFLLGATLGFGMTFWDAFWAITIGVVVLEIVAIATGIMGMREGLNTSLLARWSGFGRYGAAIIGIIITISLVGWFGVQNAVFAQGLQRLLGGPPTWVWALAGGLLVTLIVIKGFKSMAYVAWVTVPAFTLLVMFSIGSELMKHGLGPLVDSQPAGPQLTLVQGATLVAGGFIVGAVVSPDLTRFNRSVGDVVKQSLVSILAGEYLIGLAGVLMAHAVRTADIVDIIISASGPLGVIILVLSIIKVNDWNIYWSSNGLTNGLFSAFGIQVSRVKVTVLLGVLGTVLSALGILDLFIPFLTFLGVALPPVAAIMIVDYFVFKTSRQVLDASRETMELPSGSPNWNVPSLIAWAIAVAGGYLVTWGVPSLNSLVLAAVSYLVVMLLRNRFRTPVERVTR